jgi:hypothetical protein
VAEKVAAGTVGTLIPGRTGLRNIGNTCFVNSVVQALSHTILFRTFFLEVRHMCILPYEFEDEADEGSKRGKAQYSTTGRTPRRKGGRERKERSNGGIEYAAEEPTRRRRKKKKDDAGQAKKRGRPRKDGEEDEDDDEDDEDDEDEWDSDAEEDTEEDHDVWAAKKGAKEVCQKNTEDGWIHNGSIMIGKKVPTCSCSPHPHPTSPPIPPTSNHTLTVLLLLIVLTSRIAVPPKSISLRC